MSDVAVEITVRGGGNSEPKAFDDQLVEAFGAVDVLEPLLAEAEQRDPGGKVDPAEPRADLVINLVTEH